MKPELPDFMHAGWKTELGSHTFSADEIRKFAEAYDPQVFHVDAEAAKDTLFGGLCASGWHTASMWMRKQRDFMAEHIEGMAAAGNSIPRFGPSPGFENLRWHRPVFVGDTITYYNETTGCRESKSRPGWYILSGRHSGTNQNGEPVLTFESTVFVTLSS